MTTQKHRKEAAGKEKQPKTARAADASKPTDPSKSVETLCSSAKNQ
ncbi:MAG: hypothetical protein WAN53_06960 [Candidatus Bathyarchaeia archaeon]|jgi:hypothetical protein